MKIVHLSCYDVDGGAARAAWRVHDSLRSTGVESSMFVAVRSSRDPAVQQYTSAGPAARVRRAIRRVRLDRALRQAVKHSPAWVEAFRDDRTPAGAAVTAKVPLADVYHVHQITEFIDYGALTELAKRAPLVWTLHEMTPFTGGCHYAYDCDGFTRACGACPQLASRRPRDFSHAVWSRKQRVCSRIPPTRLHVVGASHWIAREARRSTLFHGFPVSVIPYGIDTSVFRPMREARRLRDAFGLSPTARIVLFVTDWTGQPRKGFDLLDAALAELRGVPDLALVSVGRGEPATLQSQVPYVHLGAFTEDRMLAAVYSMADVFVIPSRQDNLPNTVLEAMASGTPVVGFRTGGIPDMVRDGENGLLATPQDVRGLASAIEAILTDQPRRVAMGARARAIAEREYTPNVQSGRYLRLYQSLLEGRAFVADAAHSSGADRSLRPDHLHAVEM